MISFTWFSSDKAHEIRKTMLWRHKSFSNTKRILLTSFHETRIVLSSSSSFVTSRSFWARDTFMDKIDRLLIFSHVIWVIHPSFLCVVTDIDGWNVFLLSFLFYILKRLSFWMKKTVAIFVNSKSTKAWSIAKSNVGFYLKKKKFISV